MSNHLYDALFLPHRDRDAPFLTLADGRLETFRDFLDRSARIAHVITQLGVAPGDRLAVQVAKSPEALSVYVACVQAGVIFLPLNTAYTASEVDYFVGDATPKILVCDQKAQPALEPADDPECRWQRQLDGSGGQGTCKFSDMCPGQG